MGRANAPLFSFNQGEVSRLALARVDVAKLRLAAACQVNWWPWTLGPMMLRPGMIHVGQTYNDSAALQLPFVFGKLDVALIELTDNLMRVRVDEALVARVAVATAISDPTFATGVGWTTANSTSGAVVTVNTGVGIMTTVPTGGLAQIQQVVNCAAPDRNKEHALRVVVANGPVTVRIGSSAGAEDLLEQTPIDTGTHSLAFTPGTATFTVQIESTDAWQKTLLSVSIESAGNLTLPTPWDAVDLANVRYDQSGDVVYIACYGKPQYKIERRGTSSWSVVLYRSNDGPFLPSPSANAGFTFGGYAPNTTVTSDRPFFKSTHVGATFRAFCQGQVYGSTRLGGSEAFSPAVRVSGVGSDARDYDWAVSGVYTGVLTFQRSFDGPDSGFVDVTSAAIGATGSAVFSSTTGGSGGTPALDNIVCWERIGFKAGNYTSGVASAATDYHGDGAYAIFRVLGFASATSVNVELLGPLPNKAATRDWQEQDWSEARGYPSSVRLFDGRLFWFGRDKFWGSASDSYTSYADADSNGNSLGDAGAMNEQFGSGPVDTVSWGLALTRLLVGREGSVASIRASAFDEVLTPTNVSSKDCTTQGAERLPAVRVDTSGFYVQQGGRRVYLLSFDSKSLDYRAHDLTRLNLDIGKPGFVSLDIQNQPDTNLHLVRSDGQMATLLYDLDDEVECFTRSQTVGVIEGVCVLPDAGIEDLVYLTVRRNINGVTRRFVERIAHRDSCVGGLLNVQADCCFSYSGVAITVAPIPWLPNTTVVIWADGADRGVATTDGSGNCALGGSYQNVVVGLGGQVVIGSTLVTLPNGSAPDQVFADELPTGTLTVSTGFNGYPAEVFADIGATGKLVHVGTITVSAGAIVLPEGRTATTIVACIGYVAPFMSAKLAYAAELGSALTQKKRIGHVGLVLQDTHKDGLRFGQRFDHLDPLPAVASGAVTADDTVWPEFDEPMIEVGGEWDTDARLCLLAQAPRPCTVAAAVVDITTNEK